MFDTDSFNASSGTMDPLSVVTVTLLEGNKHTATAIDGITCLWDSRYTNIMIKIKINKYYEHKMQSNKIEYSTAAGVYCTTHDVKVPFCMLEVSISKIINHRFHVDNYKVESRIGYAMILGHELMVQLGLTAKFKHKVLQWDGATVHMKEPSSLLGQSGPSKRNMRKVVIQTTEPSSTREATLKMVKNTQQYLCKGRL